MNMRRILVLTAGLSVLLTACPNETKPTSDPTITALKASANPTTLNSASPSSDAQEEVPASGSILYGVLPNGELKWFGHIAALYGGFIGPNLWASNSNKTIGIGWNGFKQIFSGGEGVIYGVMPSGELKWYRNTGYRTGGGYNDAGGWDPKSGKTIGIGWNGFKQIFSTKQGVIYGVQPNGELKWYRNTGYLTGAGYNDAGGWDPKSGKTIGIGWSEFDQLFSGGNGVIYGVQANGDLKWYRNTGYLTGAGYNDAGGWDTRSGKTIGIGWGALKLLMATSGGVIYGVLPNGILNGELKWYRHTGYITGAGYNDPGGWDTRSGKTVGFNGNRFQDQFGF